MMLYMILCHYGPVFECCYMCNVITFICIWCIIQCWIFLIACLIADGKCSWHSFFFGYVKKWNAISDGCPEFECGVINFSHLCFFGLFVSLLLFVCFFQHICCKISIKHYLNTCRYPIRNDVSLYHTHLFCKL